MLKRRIELRKERKSAWHGDQRLEIGRRIFSVCQLALSDLPPFGRQRGPISALQTLFNVSRSHPSSVTLEFSILLCEPIAERPPREISVFTFLLSALQIFAAVRRLTFAL